MGYKMPSRTWFFYRQFVEFANIGDPFGYHDMERFFHFVWAAHQGRAKLDEHRVRAHLLEDGFQPDDAEHLATVFGHCREFAYAKRTIPWVERDDWNGIDVS